VFLDEFSSTISRERKNDLKPVDDINEHSDQHGKIRIDRRMSTSGIDTNRKNNLILQKNRSIDPNNLFSMSSPSEDKYINDNALNDIEENHISLKNPVYGFLKITLWFDNFNNIKKCWEPITEKVISTLMFEQVIN
jgi:hypothetical protein